MTLGIGEPFTTTITVTLFFALIISLPVILFELYGFVLPAFSPRERRIALPLLAAIPFLFVIGVAFGYFVVLPAAVRFFQNFNSGEFNVLVQANQYYKFAATILLAMGLVFQVPVAILGATRVGIVTPQQLRHNRRYAILACAAMAAFLPGDAVTLLLETVPLYILYEISILLASFLARRDAKRAARKPRRRPVAVSGPGGGPRAPGDGGGGVPAPSALLTAGSRAGRAAPLPSIVRGGAGPRARRGGGGPRSRRADDGVEPDVKQIIDHIDRELS